MSANIGIIGHTDRAWSDLWQVEANVMARLAERWPTIWMNPPRHWRDALSAPRGLARFTRPREAPGLEAYTPPPWLPTTHRPAGVARRLHRARLAAARRRLEAAGAVRIVLYVWRPALVDALDLVDHDAMVYHICDEYSFSQTDEPTSPAELRLLREADQVIVHSPALLEKKGGINPHTVLIPNGVDYDWFADPCDEPSDIAHIPRPRIGYTGYVKRQLDWELLRTLVDRHTDWSWVFVGQVSPHPELGPVLEALDTRPHVHFLGSRPSRDLARYPQHFDVCIMPYDVNDYTRYISPLKLHEYLASGSPAVGTPVRTLLDYDEIVQIASGPDEWSSALARALDPAARAPDAVAERQRIAKAHDWDRLVDRVAAAVQDAVDRAGGG